MTTAIINSAITFTVTLGELEALREVLERELDPPIWEWEVATDEEWERARVLGPLLGKLGGTDPHPHRDDPCDCGDTRPRAITHNGKEACQYCERLHALRSQPQPTKRETTNEKG